VSLVVYTLLFSGIVSVAILVVLMRAVRVSGGSGKFLLFSFAAGFCAAFPAWFLEREMLPYMKWITGPGGDAARAFGVAGFVEEGVKTLVLLSLSQSRFFRRISDGLYLATALGLGFAFSENIFFSLENPVTLLLRGVTSVPLHALALALAGWTLGLSRFTYKPLFPAGFCAAVVLHGAYDFFLLRGGWYRFFSFGLLAAAFFLVAFLLRSAWMRDIREGRIVSRPPGG
jgi:RsiW-degrading membrane proteinase PrsW (M82 family)